MFLGLSCTHVVACYTTCVLVSVVRMLKLLHHAGLELSSTHTQVSYTTCVVDSVVRIQLLATSRVSWSQLYTCTILLHHTCWNQLYAYCILLHHVRFGISCAHNVAFYTTCAVDSPVCILLLSTPLLTWTVREL